MPSLKVETEIKQEFGSPDTTRRRNKREVKLQKGLILSSAAEYIRTLQARNSELEARNSFLERRLACLQKVALEKESVVVRCDEVSAERET